MEFYGFVQENKSNNNKNNKPRKEKPKMKLPKKIRSGFSLVELLVVIAVIAVIAAIAIPNISNITQSASEATQLRNAQQLVTTWNNYVEAATAAGATLVAAPTQADLGQIATGIEVVNTRLNTTMTFALQGITADQINWNAISTSGNYLVYQPDGNGTQSGN